MKKSILFSLAMISIILIIVSCTKDEVPELTQRNVPKATIKGQVFADIDASTASSGYEAAPSGTKIMAQVYSADLMPGVDLDIPATYISYQATVDASGNYSVQVDATTDGLNVRIIADDFEYQQKQNAPLAAIRKIYRSSPFEVSVVAGKITVQDIYYTTSF